MNVPKNLFIFATDKTHTNIMTVYGKIKHYVKIGWEHRIGCAIVLFLGWMTFFDQHSFPKQWTRYQNILSLRNEKQYYINKIHNDSIMLNELKTNDKNLEKYAREQYFMKADDEDVFEIVEMP